MSHGAPNGARITAQEPLLPQHLLHNWVNNPRLSVQFGRHFGTQSLSEPAATRSASDSALLRPLPWPPAQETPQSQPQQQQQRTQLSQFLQSRPQPQRPSRSRQRPLQTSPGDSCKERPRSSLPASPTALAASGRNAVGSGRS